MCNSKDGNIDLRDIDLASLFTCSATSDNNSGECHDLNKPPAYHVILYKKHLTLYPPVPSIFRFLHFLLAHYIEAFKPVKDKKVTLISKI